MAFTAIFKQLKSIMKGYATNLVCAVDKEDEYHLDTEFVMKNKKPLFFGAVKINKNYVSYHLMPVYVNADLLKNMSPELRKRMQGKSCFNFKTEDEVLFEEIASLTKHAYQYYVDDGYVQE